MFASKLICMYFQSNSTPLAPTHNGRSFVITSSAVAQPAKNHYKTIFILVSKNKYPANTQTIVN